ncbi:MAG: SIMPL domain-containing protein [Blautia sp.]|nr:SIMPL domain-containing protein [Blautia sp.]
MNDMRTIRVTGKGQIRVRPDMTRITITLGDAYAEYDETLRHSAQDTEQLKDILEPYGFVREDLKTLSFQVDPQYEGYKKNGVYQQKLTGYKFRHVMKVEFESDNDQLGKILYALANCPAKPDFRISYTVKDPEAAKNELLGKAVTDAIHKATVLAAAAGVKLREIRSIDYSWGEMDIQVNPMYAYAAAGVCAEEAGADYALNLEPDDIEVSDTVTVVWNME